MTVELVVVLEVGELMSFAVGLVLASYVEGKALALKCLKSEESKMLRVDGCIPFGIGKNVLRLRGLGCKHKTRYG